MITKRIKLHTKVKHLTSTPPFPKTAKIEITSRCNLNCEWCASRTSGIKKGDMDEQFFYSLVERLKEQGVKEIGLFLLGEPFIISKLPAYIRHCKKIGIEYVFITTNGTLCTPDNLKDCFEAGLDSLKFSIYDESNLDIIKWTKEYDGKKPKIYAGTVGKNEELESLFSPYVDEFYCLPLYNCAGAFDSGVSNIGLLDDPADPMPCWVLFNSMRVTWDGHLTMCCFDNDGSFKGANLNEVSLMEAWNDKSFVELRQAHLDGDASGSLCAKCLGVDDG